MSKEELEKLEREKYVVERKLTAAMHKEKRLQSELKRLTRSERTHRLCTRAGMLETFLKEPTTLTDDDVMELLTFIFHSESGSKEVGFADCETERELGTAGNGSLKRPFWKKGAIIGIAAESSEQGTAISLAFHINCLIHECRADCDPALLTFFVRTFVRKL